MIWRAGQAKLCVEAAAGEKTALEHSAPKVYLSEKTHGDKKEVLHHYQCEQSPSSKKITSRPDERLIKGMAASGPAISQHEIEHTNRPMIINVNYFSEEIFLGI